MQTQFHFRHMETSDALREYAQERLGKIARYFSDPIRVHGTFTVESKVAHTAQFDVVLRNGLQLHASEQTENMYSSVDLALAKMERQVRRYKDRIRHHKQAAGKAARVRMAIIAAESVEQEAQAAAAAAEGARAAATKVVRESEFHAPALSVDEAIMQMNLLQRAFFVYMDRQSGSLNVVYRRDDADYGLIETGARME